MSDLVPFYEKVLAYNISVLSLCDNKDLLGLVTDDDTIVIKRISNHPKKIVSLDETIKIVSFCFKTEGEAIAVGGSEGAIKIYTLSSTSLRLFFEHHLHTCPISLLKWYSFSRHSTIPAPAISKYIPNPSIPSDTISGFSLLLSQDTSSSLSLIVNGIYPLALFNFASGRAISSQLTSDLDTLHCVSEREGWYLDSYDVCILNKKSRQIQEIAEIYALCQGFFMVLGKGVKEVVKEAGAVCGSFIGRYLQGIEDALQKAGNISTVEELLSQCAGTGVISPCLSKFIKEELQNTKAITQYEEKLNIQVRNCQITLIQDCKNSITGLIFHLTSLINYSKCSLYAPLGLTASLLQQLVDNLSDLLHKVMETMSLLSNSHTNIVNIVHWLHNWNVKLGKEDEQAEAPEEWPVNLKQLIKYLDSHHSLYFLDLNSYIKGNLFEHFQAAARLWRGFSSEMPLSLPRYFMQKSSRTVCEAGGIGCEISCIEDEVVVGVFAEREVQVFRVKGESERRYRISCGFSLRFLGYYSRPGKSIVAGGSDGEAKVEVVAENGEVTHSVKYAGEEFTACAFSSNRAIACIVTNERTLRFFDVEEV